LTGRKLTAFSLTLVLAFLLCASAGWSSSDFINSTQSYGVGAWWNTVYGSVTYGSTMNLRGDLGMKEGKPAVVVDAEWQFNDKWGAKFDYFYVKHTGSSTSARTTLFNGAQIIAGDRMASTLSISTASLMAKYSLYRSEDSKLDVLGGVKLMSIDLTIAKEGNVNPVVAPAFNFSLRPTQNFMPAIGISGKQRISDRIHMFGDFSGMFDVGNNGGVSNGYVADLKAGLRYQFQHPGWYLTLDYRMFGANVQRTNGNASKIWWNGPAVTIRYEF
jgi:hypothetical protein